MSKPSNQGSEATQFKKGASGNPGGITAEERQARDALRKALLSDDMQVRGLDAYRRCLEADNPVIVKDFMDRVLGKVKERVEMSEDPDAPMLGGWSLTDVLAALTAAREKPK